ncbi:peptidase S8 [Agrobacterium rubi]|nr:peptidase S8 [Agrobacterium rubi]
MDRREPAVPQRVPDEIVAYDLDDPTITTLTQQGFTLRERTELALLGADVFRLGIPRGMSLEEARDVVNASHPEASGDFNHYYQTQARRPDICTGDGCHLIRQMVGWPSGGNAACLKPQKIGLIDTAINAYHAALQGANVKVLALNTEDRPKSGAKHGTAVAALLAGGHDSRVPGLLPGAEVVAVDAFQRFGRSSDIASTFDLVRSLEILVEQDVKVINLSLTGPSNDVLANVIRAVSAGGVFLVAAAGNDGPNAEPVYPAAFEEVIAVTAVDRARQPYRRAVRGDHIDIAAPGVGVWTAASISGARQQTGTSFAAPFVTATVAVLVSAKPDMSQEELEARLIHFSEDLGVPGRDQVFGWGVLNARGLCGSNR